jgi:hypothetical protein
MLGQNIMLVVYCTESDDYGYPAKGTTTWKFIVSRISTDGALLAFGDDSGVYYANLTDLTVNPTWQKLAFENNLWNKNLLDNANFENSENVVNQKGQTSYTGGIGIDRWNNNSIITHTLEPDGLVVSRIESPSSNTQTSIYQILEFPQSFAGQQVTLSGLFTENEAPNGRIRLQLNVVTASGNSNINSADADANGFVTVTGTIPNDTITKILFAVLLPTGGQANTAYRFKIKNLKLEIGPVSTILNEPPQNYTEELIKCQRFQTTYKGPGTRIRSSQTSANTIDFAIPTPVLFRNTPSINQSNGNFVVAEASTNAVVSGFTYSILSLETGFVMVRATKTAHGITDAFLTIGTGFVLLDANL